MSRQSILIRIDADEPARLWSGVGDLIIPPDAVEADYAEYLGGGELVNAPDFQQLINGIAERIDIVVSGVSAEAIRLSVEEAASAKGARVDIGVITFNEDWSAGVVSWIGQFRVDTLTVGSQPSQDGRTRTLTLSIASDDTNRSRAPMAFFTDADQRRRSPTDAIFDQVAAISAGTSRRFGPS